MPWTWWVSRVCEEFHCLPSEALKELRRAPEGLVEDIVEARAFAATWRVWSEAKEKKSVPPSPMLDLVIEIEMTVRQEQIAAQQKDHAP